MTTTNTQTGVLNHLTEAQEEKLVQFKAKLLKDGWWSPDGVNGKPTHDDGTLLWVLIIPLSYPTQLTVLGGISGRESSTCRAHTVSSPTPKNG